MTKNYFKDLASMDARWEWFIVEGLKPHATHCSGPGVETVQDFATNGGIQYVTSVLHTANQESIDVTSLYLCGC